MEKEEKVVKTEVNVSNLSTDELIELYNAVTDFNAYLEGSIVNEGGEGDE